MLELRGRGGENLIGPFPVAALLELDLTSLLDEVASIAAASSREVVTTVTRDVVTATSVTSLDPLCGD